ncbi:MAG: methyltransferase family protein [Thermocrispum sp.]
MDSALIALLLYAAYLATAFGLRTWQHRRRTGSSGFHGLPGPVWSLAWWGGVLFVLAAFAGLAAPVLQLLDVLDPVAVLDGSIGQIAGAALALLGMIATLAAQHAMGNSWRIGVDPTETTTLVRSGVFRYVRNPIFTAMLTAVLGLVLLAPNAAAVIALVALVTAIELQVRLVEEPYLQQTHGAAYRDYATKVGRFLPGIGRATRQVSRRSA